MEYSEAEVKSINGGYELARMPFKYAYQIAQYLMPRCIEVLMDAHDEHGDSWRNGDEERLAEHARDGSTAELTMIHVLRKLQSYKTDGDIGQLIGAINYIILEAGRKLNAEAGNE